MIKSDNDVYVAIYNIYINRDIFNTNIYFLLQLQPEEVQEPILMRPPAPAYETAWERGLRQAKEMRRRSHKRREMDVEYEEKKSNLSLTQVQLKNYIMMLFNQF